MSDKIKSNAEHQQNWTEAVRESQLKGAHSFQRLFDESKDVNQSIVRGYWDLTFHILTKKVCRHINNPEEKVALEIGYGGGRILNAACGYFKQVIGIDIHNEHETVETLLRSQGKSNFKLIRTSGDSIGVESESIDFIYSFIVLQHLPSFDVFVSYLKETYRCLRPGGVAQLYFGSYFLLNPLDQLRYYIRGYKELVPESPVYTTLVIRVPKAKKLCEDIGFKVVETGNSYRRGPDGYPRVVGGQNYITLLKEV